MAKQSRSVSFRNLMIDSEAGTMSEFVKDDCRTYRIDTFLKEWSGIPNLTLLLKEEKELPGEDE